MYWEAFNRAIVIANTVDGDRLADDPDYRARVIKALQCDPRTRPSLMSRLYTALARFLPKAA